MLTLVTSGEYEYDYLHPVLGEKTNNKLLWTLRRTVLDCCWMTEGVNLK